MPEGMRRWSLGILILMCTATIDCLTPCEVCVQVMRASMAFTEQIQHTLIIHRTINSYTETSASLQLDKPRLTH